MSEIPMSEREYGGMNWPLSTAPDIKYFCGYCERDVGVVMDDIHGSAVCERCHQDQFIYSDKNTFGSNQACLRPRTGCKYTTEEIQAMSDEQLVEKFDLEEHQIKLCRERLSE